MIFLIIWVGWERWKEIWVCVNFLLSMCKDEAGTTNTDITKVSGLNVGVMFPSEALTSNFPHRWIPQSHSCHCLPVNRKRVFLGKQSQEGSVLVMRHAAVELWWQCGPLPFNCLLTASRKWKQQVVEWNGLNSHYIYCICLLMRTTWKRHWFVCQTESITIWTISIYYLFPIVSYPFIFSLKGKCCLT